MRINVRVVMFGVLNPVTAQGGSWSVNYVFRQYIVERAARDGWGFFSQASFADSATSPVTTFFDVGLGGNGVIAARPRDEFGVAYAYTDLSEELKDNLDLLPLGGRRAASDRRRSMYTAAPVVSSWLES
jgi:carbohydrate-selective porin OprB